MSFKKELFSIGEFSKVTGIGIHSLRYYDEIGALKPIYIDPVTSYRYYSFDQIRLIPGINICKEAGIRLSEFDNFISSDNIDYSKLILESKIAIERKISDYRLQQDELTNLETLLSLKEHPDEEAGLSMYMNDKAVWAMPYNSDSFEKHEGDVLVELASHARKRGCQISPEYFGLLRTGYGAESETYAFAKIQEIIDSIKASPFIMHIPSGQYSINTSLSCSLPDSDELPGITTSRDSGVSLAFILLGNDLHTSLYFNAIKCN